MVKPFGMPSPLPILHRMYAQTRITGKSVRQMEIYEFSQTLFLALAAKKDTLLCFVLLQDKPTIRTFDTLSLIRLINAEEVDTVPVR